MASAVSGVISPWCSYTVLMNFHTASLLSRPTQSTYLQMGEVYRRKGDDVSAIAALQKAREILPEDGRVMTTLALTFDHAGRTPEAKQIYEAALKLEPGNGVALNN